jgi:hypothetical protein
MQPGNRYKAMKVLVLMCNDSVIGVYNTTVAITAARDAHRRKMESGAVSCTLHYHQHEFILNDDPK